MSLVVFDLDDTLLGSYGRPEEAWRKVVAEHARDLPASPCESFAGGCGKRVRSGRMTAPAPPGPGRDRGPKGNRAAGFRGGRPGARRSCRGAGGSFLATARGGDGAVSRCGVAFARAAGGGGAGRPADQWRRRAATGKNRAFRVGGHVGHIQIEGDAGDGKPVPEAYRLCLRRCAIRPQEAVRVGDNLEWDVIGPKRSGMGGVWFNPAGAPLPGGLVLAPDRIVATLAEVGEHLIGARDGEKRLVFPVFAAYSAISGQGSDSGPGRFCPRRRAGRGQKPTPLSPSRDGDRVAIFP